MTSLTLPLRVAVVGLGPMGMHHVRAYADLVATKLVAVVDINQARADEVASQFKCASFYTVDNLIGAVDAVTIATPPEFHAATAVPLLNMGTPCLIEKPLALREGDCTAIIRAAEKTNTLVAVGHVERFNPATESLFAQNIPGEQIKNIKVRRFSPASGRQVPVDVVCDMMIHDLEIVLALKNSKVTAVAAQGVADEHATAVLTFADGTTASIATNRKAEKRVRELIVDTPTHTYTLDFMGRAVTKTSATQATPESLSIDEHDALRGEISDFLSAVKTQSLPRVTANHALEAMHVAWRVLDAIKGKA